MRLDELRKDLTLEMIPNGVYREIAETIGIDNILKLASLVGGTTFYLPKLESLLRPVVHLRIKAEFNGHNILELARKYDKSERWVRQLCGEEMPEGQISLFDLELESDAESFRTTTDITCRAKAIP